jgi:drug/metabolite transporter (DMT)-like permease
LQIIALAVIISSVIVLTINSAKDQKGGGEQKQGLLFAVLGALFQAVSLILSKYALDEIGPISTNAIRSIGGLASLFLFAVFRGKARAEFSAYRHKPKFFLILVAGSLLGPIIGMSCEMKAFTLAPVGTVSALAQTSPLILLFQDKLIFHNKIGLSNAIATLSCIAGITLLFITI